MKKHPKDRPAESQGRNGKRRWTRAAFVLAFVLYAAAWILGTVCVYGGKPYFLMADDAMISMKYAYNLANGHGLTWNPGEMVEGITNVGWTLVLAVPHLLGVDVHWTALFVYGLNVFLLIMVAVYAERLASKWGVKHTMLPFLTVLFYYSAFYWGMMGFETSLLALLLLVVLCHDGWPAVLAGAAGIVVRMDFAVPVVAVALSFRRWKLLWALVAVAPLAGFQKLYYGDALPNTYYLKLTGYPVLLRIHWGFVAFRRFGIGILPVLAVAYFADGKLDNLWMVVFSVLFYSIWVGGDAWEIKIGGANRYMCLVMPLLIVLFYASVERIKRLAKWRWPVFAAALLFLNAPLGLPSVGQALLISPQTYSDEFGGMVALEEFTRGATKDGDSLAVMWAGFIPYYLPDRRYTDLLGKCDRHIARLPVDLKANPGPFSPGHNKFDFPYSWAKCNWVTSYGHLMAKDVEDRLSDGRAAVVRDCQADEFLIKRIRT